MALGCGQGVANKGAAEKPQGAAADTVAPTPSETTTVTDTVTDTAVTDTATGPQTAKAPPVEPPAPAESPPPAAPAKSPSQSLGYPNDGTLQNASALPLSTPALRFNPRRPERARFATDEVIQAIERAARKVAQEAPGSQLVVNDLSLQEGGPIEHHGSHRNGRDADILFYLLGEDGTPTPSVGAPLDPEGRGHDYKDLSIKEDDVPVRLDAPRTWRFVQALLEDPNTRVQRIFVVEHIRSLLLEQAQAVGAPAAVIEQFGHVACQPAFPHDDHLHIRWFCHQDDIAGGCEDMHPIYPWHRAYLTSLGVSPKLAVKRRKPPRAKVTSHAQARKKAGRLHPSVKRFLERRKAWLPQPHPGRRYCR